MHRISGFSTVSCPDAAVEQERMSVLRAYQNSPAEAARLLEHRLTTMTEHEVVNWLAALTDDNVATLHASRFRPTYLNLLTLMHEYSQGDVTAIAAQATRVAVWANAALQRWISTIPGTGGLSAIHSNIDCGPLQEAASRALSLRKGLIVCSYRLGAFPFLPVALTSMGLSVTWPMKRCMCDGVAKAVRKCRDAAQTDISPLARLRLIDAESPAAPLMIAKALGKGEVVVFNVDGNTGSDGPWGHNSRHTVSFFNTPIAVKTGVAKLALQCGTPILPVMSPLSESGCYRPIPCDLIPVPSGRTPDADGAFIANTMQDVYTVLENYGRVYLDQWPGVSAVHRWRGGALVAAGSGVEEPPADSVDQLMVRFAAGNAVLGASFANTVVCFRSHTRSTILVDTRTLQCVEIRPWSVPLLSKLDAPDGLRIQDVYAEPEWRGAEHKVLEVIRGLVRRGLVSQRSAAVDMQTDSVSATVAATY